MTASIQNRVLLALCLIGASASLWTGFLDAAPNRLAHGVALSLAQGPAIEAGAIAAGLCGLAISAFLTNAMARVCATIFASAVILWASLSGAGHFATLLSKVSPPAARFSLGPAFWALIVVALLAMLDAAQRLRLPLVLRAGIIAALCAGVLLMARAGVFADLSLAKEFSSHRVIFFSELWRHLALVGGAMLCALGLGVPLAALVLRKPKARGLIFSSLGVLQTIPSIALFGVLISPLSALSRQLPALRDFGVSGTGWAPAVVALTLYSLPPLVRSFYKGVAEVPADVKDAAKGVGFDAREIFFAVELPLALPALLSGLRVVAIQAIGLAAVAALIGAGGLGAFVFQGIGQYALDLVLVGALPIILLALAADLVFQILLAAARRRT